MGEESFLSRRRQADSKKESSLWPAPAQQPSQAFIEDALTRELRPASAVSLLETVRDETWGGLGQISAPEYFAISETRRSTYSIRLAYTYKHWFVANEQQLRDKDGRPPGLFRKGYRYSVPMGIESQTGKSYLGIRFNLDGYHSDRQFCDDAWLIVEYYDDTNYENRMAFTRINRDVKIRPSNLPYLEQQYFDPGAGRWVSGAPIFQGRETRYEITMSSKRSKSLIEDALWEDCKRREQNGGAGLPENISQTSREIAEAELAEGPKRLEW